MNTKLFTLFFALMAAMAINAQDPIPATCAEAAAAMPAQAGDETADVYIVTGYITNTNGTISKGQQTFYMDDAKGTKKTLQGYWCNLPAEEVEANRPLNVGDKISLKGKIINYNNTPEIKNGDVAILERAVVKIDTIDATVCEALDEGSSLNDKDYSDDVFRVYGRLKGADQLNYNGRHTFEMACGDEIFKPYNCTGEDGFQLGKGDSVKVTCKLYNYGGVIETANGKVELIEKSSDFVHPVTVAEAIALTSKMKNGAITDDRYAVTGYVVEIETGFNEQYENISFYMADDASSGARNFLVYLAKVSKDNAPKLVAGAKVKVISALKRYYKAATGDLPEIDHTETITGGTIEYILIPCTLALLCNSEHGFVEGAGVYIQQAQTRITATANHGYHFTQWSDGNTDNPRTIVLTQDTTFTAEFTKNTYTISTTSANPEWGTTAGGKSALYLDEVEISATPNYGYHFVQWSDGNTSNPRTISVTEDKTLTATFAKNVYSITKNAEHGTISGNSSAEYLDFVTLTVTPDYGYHFTQWSDGLKDNPRIAQITQDTTFTAEFAYDRVGTCGKDLALVWSYDPTNKVLTIGNAGEFTENMQFGVEAPTEMEELVIGNNVTAIGENAFAGISTLKKVTIGESVKTIYDKAFYNCVNLETIFNYRPTPTNAYSTAFDGVDKFECILYVLPNSIDMYKNASVWRDFYYTYAIGATAATVNEVSVTPAVNTAAVAWPAVENAFTYELVIKDKSGNIVCTLVFNANGQLTAIAFAAPGRAQASTQATGFSFTVTGLDSGTGYDLTINAKDDQGQVISTTTQSFTTASDITTGIDATTDTISVRKQMINGQLYILRDGKTYTAQGQEVK